MLYCNVNIYVCAFQVNEKAPLINTLTWKLLLDRSLARSLEQNGKYELYP